MKFKHVICKTMYYTLQRLEVSAHRLRLRRTKVKEMEARPFEDACDADRVQIKCILFSILLEDQKFLSGED